MPDIKKLERTWIENFKRSPLVDQSTGTFKSNYAFQLYYGRENELYPINFPQNFSNHYSSYLSIERNNSLNIFLGFLNFIGIEIKKELLLKHTNESSEQYQKFASKCNNILKTLAHYDKKLTVYNPYKDNLQELTYLLRIECDNITQITIFDELELPNLYSRFVDFPSGYESDEIVNKLFNKIENGASSFFITGKAGTGKSTFIQYFASKTKKKLLMCAFTGIAAINIRGQTIHSFFRFPTQVLLPEDEEIKKFGKNSERYKIIQEIQTIVIDEVSMLRSDLLEAIDYSLRINGGDPKKTFGGKQLLFVGDIFQLPPVTDDADEVDNLIFTEIYKSKYFFDAPAYRKLNPGYFEFKKSYRQEKDTEFVKILDSVRICETDEDVLATLNGRYFPAYVPKNDEFVITLASSNLIAGSENMRRLMQLPYTLFRFDAEITGEFKESKYPTNKILELKKNSQIIFVKNDAAKNWVNGTIAKIEFISDDILEIKLQDGSLHKLEKAVWENRVYKYSNGKIVSELKGTFTQFPVKLAWAITIHKSQGLTFEKVAIDIGSGAFINGQLYTALSRCRSLNGIALKKLITPKDIITDDRIIAFHETEQLINSIDFNN
jgi:ATP-dependent DNA helicase PIF1